MFRLEFAKDQPKMMLFFRAECTTINVTPASLLDLYMYYIISLLSLYPCVTKNNVIKLEYI